MRRTSSAPWGVAAIGLAFVAFYFLINTSYRDPSASWTCAGTPVQEVIDQRRQVTFVDAERQRRTTDNPCLEPATEMVGIGMVVAVVALAAGTVAFRKRTRTPVPT